MSALLHVDNISKRFGGFVALDGIDLEVQAGERLGLIGPNGSGKSTLVNCICGTLQNETGSVRSTAQALDGLAAHQRTHRGLARSFQLPRPFHSMTLADNLRIPLLYTVHAAPGTAAFGRRSRRALPRTARLVGLARQGQAAAARSDAGRDAQARAGARHGGGAETPDRRRGRWPGCRIPRSTTSWRCCCSSNERGITIILIEHIMSAVMSFSQRLACWCPAARSPTASRKTSCATPKW